MSTKSGEVQRSSPNGKYFYTRRDPHSSNFLTVLDRDGNTLFSHPNRRGDWYAFPFSDDVLAVFIGEEVRFLNAVTGVTIKTIAVPASANRKDNFPYQPTSNIPVDGGQMLIAWHGQRLLIDSTLNVSWEYKNESGLKNASFSADGSLIAVLEQIEYGERGNQITLLDSKSGRSYWSEPINSRKTFAESDHRDLEFIGNYIRILSPQTQYICGGVLRDEAVSHLFRINKEEKSLVAQDTYPGALFMSDSRKSLIIVQARSDRKNSVIVEESTHANYK